MNKANVKLYDLSRLHRQLQADNSVPLKQLQQRDHAFRSECQSLTTVATLQCWLDRVAPIAEQRQQHNADIETSISLWLTLLGFVAGVIVMAGLLLVGQQQVINVLLFLAVFIGSQLLVLALTLVIGIGAAGGFFTHLPLEHFNPARLLFRRALRKLSGNIRWDNFSDIVRLALLRWGQLFGVAFNVGAIAAFFVVLAAADRSFGWSSTFNIGDETLLYVVKLLSSPWAWLFHGATVDLEIISASRMQSLQAHFDTEQVAMMRAWWPFLLACIVCYGLLPRLILLPIFQRLYRRKLQNSFVRYPGAHLVVERIRAPSVSTQAEGKSAHLQKTGKAATGDVPVAEKLLVSWIDAIEKSPAPLKALGFNRTDFSTAGLDLDSDQQLLEHLKQSSNKALVVAVKSWEPPVAELEDFLAGVGNLDRYLLLLPLNDRAIAQSELQDWQQFAFNTNTQLLLGAEVEKS